MPHQKFGDQESTLTCLQIGLLVTGVTIASGTHSLYNHNTTNLSFAFSHIVAKTRDEVFSSILSNAESDLHHQVMEEAREKLCFGKEGFTRDADSDDSDV